MNEVNKMEKKMQCRPKDPAVLYHGNLTSEYVQADLSKNQIWEIVTIDELYVTIKRNCFTLHMTKQNFDYFFELK